MAKASTNGSSQTAKVEGLVTEKVQCLIAPRRSKIAKAFGVQPMSAGALRNTLKTLENMSGCEVHREIRPRHRMRTLSVSDEATSVIVASLDLDSANALMQTAPPNLSVELDHHLDYGLYRTSPVMQAMLAQRVGSFRGNSGIIGAQVRIKLVGPNNEPIPHAKIILEAEGFPQEGESDKNGEAALSLFTATNGRARSIFITPSMNYWPLYLRSPSLDPQQTNVVRLQSLAETVSGFPAQFRHGWGQVLMGLDQLPDEYTGKGVKVAIIDSGADSKHPNLKHITQGLDLTNDENTKTWADDVVGHGSHCAGVITANSATASALRGFVPDAEIHVLKVFPGGQFSSLLDALHYCIAEGIDVVNMSLGSPEASEAVEQSLEEAVEHGVACIVAAGNSGGPVQYPARSPNVLAVSAIGALSEVRPNTWDALTVNPALVAPDGTFSPTFTCFGPEVAVTGPGVGVISTVPDNGFDPQSGTSMAAPHIAGLAALLVAHHPAFKGALRARNAQRVQALFNMVRSFSTPYQLGDGRTGSGLPTLHGIIPIFEAASEQAAADGERASPEALAAMSVSPLMAGAMPGTMVGGMLGQYPPAQFAAQGVPAGFVPLQAAPGLVLGGAYGNGGLAGSVPYGTRVLGTPGFLPPRW